MRARKGGCARAGGYNRQLQIWSRASPPHARFALQATQTQQDELEPTLPRSLESALDKVADKMLCINDFYDGDVGEAEAHVHVDSQRF